MDVSRTDASAALADVAAAQSRSATLRGYQSAAPHLMIWGVVWAAGYTVADLMPDLANVAWIVLVVAGTLGDMIVARADRANGGHGAVIGCLFLTFFVLVGGTIAVMQPSDPRQIGAFVPLVVAAAYAIVGVMGMPRLLVLGGLVAALTLGGFFALPGHFLLWMAAVAGGSLILGGVWLRRV